MPAFPSLRTFQSLLFVACGLLANAGASVGQNVHEDKKPAAKGTAWDTALPRKAAPGDDELQRLRIARYNAALEEYQARVRNLRRDASRRMSFSSLAIVCVNLLLHSATLVRSRLRSTSRPWMSGRPCN